MPMRNTWTSQWFGETSATGREVIGALKSLSGLLRLAFGKETLLDDTPGKTGLRLWKESPLLLSEDIGALIRSTSAPGRQDLCAPQSPTLPAFYYYRARQPFAYFLHLPGELVQRDTSPFLAPYRPARYRVRFTVPRGWRFVGLFQAEDGSWPVEVGQTGESWVDNAELIAAERCALDYDGDWQVEILERLLFSDLRRGSLAAAMFKLLQLHSVVNDQALIGEVEPVLAELVHLALRTLLREGVAALAADHPEWTATIWARQRAALLYHGMGLRREQIVAFSGEELYLTTRPNWLDGTVAECGQLEREVVTPRTLEALAALREECRAVAVH